MDILAVPRGDIARLDGWASSFRTTLAFGTEDNEHDVTVWYNADAGEAMTRDYPGSGPSAEVMVVNQFGEDVTGLLTPAMVETLQGMALVTEGERRIAAREAAEAEREDLLAPGMLVNQMTPGLSPCCNLPSEEVPQAPKWRRCPCGHSYIEKNPKVQA